MRVLRSRVVWGFLIFNVLGGVLYVGGALLVAYMRSFGSTPEQVGWVLGAGWMASVLGAFSGGHLSDRLGARRTVLLSVTLTTVGLLVQALACDWLSAGAGHVLVMGTWAMQWASGMALLNQEVGEATGSALGLVNTAFNAAAIPGAALTGLVSTRWDWSTLYLGKVATYLLALPVLFVLMPRGKAQSERVRSGLPWRHVLAQRALLWVCAGILLVTLLGYCYAFYPYYVQERFGADVKNLALFEALYNAVWLLSNWPAGWLADRIGRGRVAMAGWMLMGVAWLLFPLSRWLSHAYVLYALYCLGNSVGFYAAVFAQDVADERFKGRAAGLFQSSMHLGSALGNAAGGMLWQRLGAEFSFLLSFVGHMLASTLLLWAGRIRGSVHAQPAATIPADD